jgi:hypothetical protein
MNEKFILKIIKSLEHFQSDLTVWAYRDGNETKTREWYTICVSDFETYMKNMKFKKLLSAWHKVAKMRRIIITFSYQNPIEQQLLKLANEENLIMDVA